MRRLLTERKKALQRAIEGLGQHGMVGTTDQRLMNLHDALKLEFQKVQQTYRDSLEQLDALALVVGKVGQGILGVGTDFKPLCAGGEGPGVGARQGPDRPEPPEAAQPQGRRGAGEADQEQDPAQRGGADAGEHQPGGGTREGGRDSFLYPLSLDWTLHPYYLQVLLGILQQRIELDKECMFQYTQLRKEVSRQAQTDGQADRRTGGHRQGDRGTQTGGQRDEQTYREMDDRHMDGQTVGQTDRQTDR